MSDDRRAATDDAQEWGPGDILAVVYTFGYLAMVGAVIVFPIPEANSQMLNTLVTIMSTIQIGIGKCYYDRNRADIAAQKVAAVEQARSSSTMREMAATAPQTIAKAVAASRSEPAPPVIVPVDRAPSADVAPAVLTAESARAILVTKGMSAEDASKLSDADAIKQATDGTVQAGTVNVQTATTNITEVPK